jgi:hypothetical protein
MSIIEQIIGAARGLALTISESSMPPEIVVTHPEGSPAEGTIAGRLLLERSEKGVRYGFTNTSPSALKFEPVEAISELRVSHKLHDLKSLADYVACYGDLNSAAFIDSPSCSEASIRVLLNEARPERGTVETRIERHPSWLAWFAGLKVTEAEFCSPSDLTHEEFADLLMDNVEDLDVQEMAMLVSRFRAAIKIEQDASLDSDGASGLRVTFSGGSSADRAPAKLPRHFDALIPPYAGTVDSGEEPRIRAKFRVRVIPSKKADSPMPTFRVTWANGAEYENEAARQLAAQVREALALPTRVYRGVPSVRRFVLPNPEPFESRWMPVSASPDSVLGSTQAPPDRATSAVADESMPPDMPF